MELALTLVFLMSLGARNPSNEKESDLDKGMNFQTEGKKVRIYLTAKNTDHRLNQTGEKSFSTLKQPDEMTPIILVDPNKHFQEIVGIGAGHRKF